MDLGFANDPSSPLTGKGPAPGDLPTESAPVITNNAGSSNGPPKSAIHENTKTRYFMIKVGENLGENLIKSVENGVWASNRRNNKLFSEAFVSSPYVILVFSVNKSGAFQGN